MAEKKLNIALKNIRYKMQKVTEKFWPWNTMYLKNILI